MFFGHGIEKTRFRESARKIFLLDQVDARPVVGCSAIENAFGTHGNHALRVRSLYFEKAVLETNSNDAGSFFVRQISLPREAI